MPDGRLPLVATAQSRRADRPGGPEPLRQLPRGQSQLEQPPVAGHPDVHPSTDRLAVEQPLQIADSLDRSTVEIEDQVARLHASGGRGAAVEQLDDLETLATTDLAGQLRWQGSRPADDTQECPANSAVMHEQAENLAGVIVDRDGEPEPDPGNRGIDADHATT